MTTGVYHTFSLSGADLSNPLYIALNQKQMLEYQFEAAQ
jgi:hypothetical protein